MKQNWTIEELEELWTLHPDELALLDNKTKENKLGFALIFKYFQIASFFPKEISDIPKAIIFHIAKQINVAAKIAQSYKLNKKSSEVYRRQIRDYLGFRKFRKEDIDKIKKWLIDLFFLEGNQSVPYLQDKIYKYLNENKIEPFSRDQSEKYIFSALNSFEKELFEKIEKSLTKNNKRSLLDLVAAQDGFVRQSTNIPLIRRNYPTLTQTHLPNEFHLLMMLPTMMPSRFWDSIR